MEKCVDYDVNILCLKPTRCGTKEMFSSEFYYYYYFCVLSPRKHTKL